MLRTLTTSFVLATSLSAQIVIGGGLTPSGPPTAKSYTFDTIAAPTRFFLDLADMLTPYQPIVAVPVGSPGGQSIPYTMSQQFEVAALTAQSFAAALHDAIGVTGTPRGRVAAVEAGVDTLRIGMAAIAVDLSDYSLDESFGPAVCATALTDLSNSIPSVNAAFAGAQQPLLDAANSMLAISTIDDPLLTEPEVAALYQRMLDFHKLLKAVANTLIPSLDAPASAAPMAPTACPPSHPYRGCTTYVKTVYTPPPFCGGWVYLAGGLSVGSPVGTTILPDSGLWVRSCYWVTSTTVKEVCECYESRWDRFWATDGINKTIETSPPSFGTDSTTDWEITGATAPSSADPSTPDPDIEVG